MIFPDTVSTGSVATSNPSDQAPRTRSRGPRSLPKLLFREPPFGNGATACLFFEIQKSPRPVEGSPDEKCLPRSSSLPRHQRWGLPAKSKAIFSKRTVIDLAVYLDPQARGAYPYTRLCPPHECFDGTPPDSPCRHEKYMNTS